MPSATIPVTVTAPSATIPVTVIAPVTMGTPTHYFIHGNCFVMDELQAGILLLDYYYKPSKILVETENIPLSDEDTEVVILYMLQRVLGKFNDWDGVLEIQRQYKEAIRQVVPVNQSQKLETLWEQGGGYN